MTEQYSTKQPQIVKELVDLAKEKNLPLNEVLQTYNILNRSIYKLDLDNTKLFKMYDSELEDKTLELTKDCINLRKLEQDNIFNN